MLPINVAPPNMPFYTQIQPTPLYATTPDAYAHLLQLQQQQLKAFTGAYPMPIVTDASGNYFMPTAQVATIKENDVWQNVQPKPLPEKCIVAQEAPVLYQKNQVIDTTSDSTVEAKPVKQRAKVATPRRYAYKKIWTDNECILLLLCTRMLIYRELKTITRAFYQCIERKPGVCWGRAAEKKLKRMITFKNWKTCNKTKVLDEIDAQLKALGASPRVSRDSKLFKVVHSIITKKPEEYNAPPNA